MSQVTMKQLDFRRLYAIRNRLYSTTAVSVLLLTLVQSLLKKNMQGYNPPSGFRMRQFRRAVRSSQISISLFLWIK